MDDKILGCKEPYRGDSEQRFEFVKSFGSGGFGTVELCRDRENNNKLVIRKLSKIEGTTMNEIAMLSHIKHKYVIKLYDYYQTKIGQNIIGGKLVDYGGVRYSWHARDGYEFEKNLYRRTHPPKKTGKAQ